MCAWGVAESLLIVKELGVQLTRTYVNGKEENTVRTPIIHNQHNVIDLPRFYGLLWCKWIVVMIDSRTCKALIVFYARFFLGPIPLSFPRQARLIEPLLVNLVRSSSTWSASVP